MLNETAASKLARESTQHGGTPHGSQLCKVISTLYSATAQATPMMD